MRNYNNQNTTYPRRSPVRAVEVDKPAMSKRLMEEFVTQLIICTLITGTVFGAQLLKVPKVDQSLSKVKTIITYSPSLKEIAKETKDGLMTLIGRMSSQDQVLDGDYTPIILVDDEIF